MAISSRAGSVLIAYSPWRHSRWPAAVRAPGSAALTRAPSPHPDEAGRRLPPAGAGAREVEPGRRESAAVVPAVPAQLDRAGRHGAAVEIAHPTPGQVHNRDLERPRG